MFWSNMLAFGPLICMVGVIVMMSLFRLHSQVDTFRTRVLIGGQMNMLCIDCEKLIHELNVVKVVLVCACLRNSFTKNKLLSRVILMGV